MIRFRKQGSGFSASCVFVLAAAFAACLPPAADAGKAKAAMPPAYGAFRNLPATPEELLSRAVACLNRGDTAGLQRLAVTRREYMQLYPFLERSDTARHDDRDFRMGFFLMDNRKMILRLFADHGNSGLEFSRLAFFAPPVDRVRFSYHGNFHAWIKHGGIEREFPIARSLIRVDGGWKFWGLKAD